MIVINFKNYRFGKEVVNLAKIIEKNCKKAVIAVPAVEIEEIHKNVSLEIFAEHVDYFEKGRATGFILAEEVKKAGASGTILNHSEHRISFGVLKKTVQRCNEVGLKVLVCTGNIGEVDKIKSLKPWAIAYEDPVLIASGKSVTSYNPKSVRAFVKKIGKSRILKLCGAGISDEKDVKAALGMGCDGVLIASAVAAAKNPEKLLEAIGKL